MIARRNELKMSDEITFDTYVRALREAKKEDDSKMSLEDVLAEKRNSMRRSK